MTSIRLVELARLAMRGVPHVDVEATIAGFRYYSQREREDAGKVYAAIIGEKTLPANIGVIHALPRLKAPLAGTERMRRNTQARRLIEARRDMQA